jgi:hypothetical protein
MKRQLTTAAAAAAAKNKKLRSGLNDSNDHPNVERYSKLHISRRSQRKLHKQTL